MKLLALATLFALIGGSIGANILAVLAFPAKSHGILLEALLRELDAHGHKVTYLTSAPPTKPLGNVTIINTSKVLEKLAEIMPAGMMSMEKMRERTAISTVMMLSNLGKVFPDFVLGSDEVQELMKTQKFDLIIGEAFASESLLAGFSRHFNAPLIGISPFMANHWANYMVGNPAPSSFIPDAMLGYNKDMTFLERVNNFLFGMFLEVYHSCIHLPSQDTIMRKYFGQDLPPIQDIIKNTSLVLVNHHYSLAFPRPYNPNMIEIGGMHIDKPKSLPEDIQKFMDSSKSGVIYFSLGSNVRSADFNSETKKSILRAFGRMKQDVLWKFEEELPNLPKNVKISSWLPQSDILAHPNLKVFITHGGLLSTTEAVERGVPVVGIPFYGDQPQNMKLTEKAGYGLSIQFDTITEETFYATVTQVVNEKKYKEAALAKSKLFKDVIMPPLESAIWWIEYVLRHKGAPQLRSAAQDLAWYELYLIDVYALALCLILPVLAINICITKAIFKKIFCRNCSKKQNKTKKND